MPASCERNLIFLLSRSQQKARKIKNGVVIEIHARMAARVNMVDQDAFVDLDTLEIFVKVSCALKLFQV